VRHEKRLTAQELAKNRQIDAREPERHPRGSCVFPKLSRKPGRHNSWTNTSPVDYSGKIMLASPKAASRRAKPPKKRRQSHQYVLHVANIPLPPSPPPGAFLFFPTILTHTQTLPSSRSHLRNSFDIRVPAQSALWATGKKVFIQLKMHRTSLPSSQRNAQNAQQ
jgi:hypothetical protein